MGNRLERESDGEGKGGEHGGGRIFEKQRKTPMPLPFNVGNPSPPTWAQAFRGEAPRLLRRSPHEALPPSASLFASDQPGTPSLHSRCMKLSIV